MAEIARITNQRRLLTSLIRDIKYKVEEQVQDPDEEDEDED